MKIMIKRDRYLQKIIRKKENGLIKVITGLRRSGKSFLIAHQTDGAMNNGIASSKAAEIARLDAGWD